MIKALRELFTGRYQSKPITLLSDEDYIEIAARDGCRSCGNSIDTEVPATIHIVNDSESGVRAYHQACPA